MVPEKVYKFDKKVDFQQFCLFGASWSTGVDQKFFSERSLQSDSKMYLHRSDISNIREVTIGDVLRRSGPYGVLAAKKSGFSTFLPFWSIGRCMIGSSS